MTTLEKFQEVANINFIGYSGDLEIGTLNTADGYDIWYVGNANDLNFDNDVFYYQPDFDAIMDIVENFRYDGDVLTISCYDIEDVFDEYYMLEYLQDNMDEDEFEKFTNENE